MQYFTADTHFFHENIITSCNRPFTSLEDMNRTLISNWNKTVNKHDEIFILGDLFFRATIEQINSTLQKLNGKKYLICGNHDEYVLHPDFDRSAFVFVKPYHTFQYHKKKFVLSHYPILEWEAKESGSILLYGHVHNDKPDYYSKILGNNAFNVGVDMTDFRPVSIKEIFQQIK